MIPGLMPMPGLWTSASVLTTTYYGQTSDTVDRSIYTFSSFAIGPASGERRIVVAVTGFIGDSATISSVTIGGVSATLHVTTGSGSAHPGAVASAVVSSGTAADVVITFSTTVSACSIEVYALTGRSTSASTTWNNYVASASTITVSPVTTGATSSEVVILQGSGTRTTSGRTVSGTNFAVSGQGTVGVFTGTSVGYWFSGVASAGLSAATLTATWSDIMDGMRLHVAKFVA